MLIWSGGGGNTFSRNRDWTGRSFVPDFSQGSVGLPIDWICEQVDAYPNFIKIDVDGNELLVLRGAEKTLRRPDCRGVYIELLERHEEFLEVCRILKESGFECDFIGDSKLYSQQELFTRNYIFEKSD